MVSQLLLNLAPRKFLNIKIGQFFPPDLWQMMSFLKPLDALIRKIPCSFFADFWVWVTSEARGSFLVGFWGSRQLGSFWGRGRSSHGALSTVHFSTSESQGSFLGLLKGVSVPSSFTLLSVGSLGDPTF